jgi:16S rRNA processing protein RimM
MRSSEQGQAAEELVTVARAVKTRGVRGEIVAELLTDFPERFANLKEVIAVESDGKRRVVLELEDYWFHADRIIFKFAGYDSIESSRSLIGCDLAVPETQCIALPDDEFYEWELTDCVVETLAGEPLGRVRELMRTGGTEVLVVENNQGREYLIPLAEDICVAIDVKEKLIRVDAPEGLLEF